LPTIHLELQINAPIDRCFDLARSIDLHKLSTGNTQEEAIAGTTLGLIGLNETVIWRAKHFGVWQTLSSKITEYERPHFFVDEMLEGAFKSIYHKHTFTPHPQPLSLMRGEQSATLMTDDFHFESPLGILGSIANKLVLTKYLTELLSERNKMIKEFAETEKWREVLK
jgi:ligand-binding SRPBCC domain-containing protein